MHVLKDFLVSSFLIPASGPPFTSTYSGFPLPKGEYLGSSKCNTHFLHNIWGFLCQDLPSMSVPKDLHQSPTEGHVLIPEVWPQKLFPMSIIKTIYGTTCWVSFVHCCFPKIKSEKWNSKVKGYRASSFLMSICQTVLERDSAIGTPTSNRKVTFPKEVLPGHHILVSLRFCTLLWPKC